MEGDASLKILCMLHLGNHVSLIIFLLLDYVELSLDGVLSLLLLSSCESLKLVSIVEGVPGGGVCTQYVLVCQHAWHFIEFHGEVAAHIAPVVRVAVRVVEVLFRYGDLRALQQVAHNIE